MTIVLILLLLIILIFYMFQSRGQCNRGHKYHKDSVGENTLNDLENDCDRRIPTYDDTSRISNQLFWSSDYSHPECDYRKNLNDDIVTPIRPVSGCNAINYFSNMHQMSRFGTEKSL